MSAQGYFYPDIGDQVTARAIEEKEPFPGYWSQSEKKVLRMFTSYIEDYLRKTEGERWFLDVGSGEGRLLPVFEKHFDHLIAVEPDKSRLKVAIKIAQEKSFKGKVRFVAESFEEIDLEEKFDVALSSHVLQHVDTKTLPQVLKKTRNVIKLGGLFLVTTCHSGEKADFFIKEYLEGGVIKEERVTEGEFNSLIINKEGVLPIHFFTFGSLRSGLEEVGFEILEFGVFHELTKIPLLDRFLDRDRVINSTPFLKERFGRDLFMVCRRRL